MPSPTSPENRHLCEYCRQITVNSIVASGPRDATIGPQQAGLLHQPTYDLLRESSETCPLCALFYHALEQKNSGKHISAEYTSLSRSRVWMHAGDHGFTDLTAPKGLYHMVVNVGGGSAVNAAPISIYSQPDDPLALSGDINGRLPSQHCDISQCANQVTEWLLRCEGHHEKCQKALIREPESATRGHDWHHTRSTRDDLPLPQRLIDVGTVSMPSLHLHETGGSYGRYCALSYSWGCSRSFRTHKATYHDRRAGFSLQDLPTTIRDAVSLTRSLGIRYLWVDALCIIQDDPKDWALQSACMDQVYGFASLTISASSSEDKWDGLFRPRQEHKSIPVFSPSSSDSSKVGTMYFSQRAGLLRDIIDRSPLARRAWTLQEDILSRRAVYVSRDQLYWKWLEHFRAEDGLTNPQGGQTATFLSAEGSPVQTWSWMLNRWRILVDNYAQRNLFDTSDMLPALAGLAGQFQKRTDATYLAGLWLEELPLGLLWTIRATDVAKSVRHCPEWRAPSWSWASLTGAIHYDGYGDLVTFSSAEKPLEQLEVLRYEIALKETANPFGEVTSAVLRVRGKTQRLRRALVRRRARRSEITVLGYALHDCGQVIFDNEMVPDVPLPEEILCLLVDRRRSAQGDYQSVLIAIEEVHGGYRRIGAGYIDGPSWFASSDTVDLSLV
ncbi:hypothetical protein LTR40_007838 [Exophiala xenobiotica]|nr:hypothetical protein LTR40_007838 [Exophiala xenobiotica]